MPRFPFDLNDPLWSFSTSHLTVGFYVSPEEDDPAGQFEYEEDVQAIRDGAVEWFTAWVVITTAEGDVLGHDSLGGCAYGSFREFYTSHRHPDPEQRNTLAQKAARRVICHYFPDMVRIAAAEARGRLKGLHSIPVRA